MCNTPPLGNIIIKFFRQLACCFFCNRVSPRSERNQKIIFLIKSKIPMHHGRKTNRPYLCKFHIIFFLYITDKILIAALKSLPHIIKIIGPYTVYILIFPFITSRSKRRTSFLNKNCFDSGRTKFNSQRCSSFFYNFFFVHALPSNI